jgi:hypothetical protein
MKEKSLVERLGIVALAGISTIGLVNTKPNTFNHHNLPYNEYAVIPKEFVLERSEYSQKIPDRKYK